MKTSKIITVGLLFSFCICLLLSISKQESDNTNIGDVKYSILPPNIFNETQKGNWVLLDGKPLSEETELYKLLEGKMSLDILQKKQDAHFLPDTRGRFIRSMNINGQGDDPEKNRKIGSYQADIFQQHTHAIGVSASDKAAASQMNRNRFADFLQQGARAPFQTHGAINGRTGEETRPKNIALYTYIKIAN